MSLDATPTCGPLGMVFQVNKSSSYSGGGGGGGNVYPLVSSIGLAAGFPDNLSTVYTGASTGIPFTDIITFQANHPYTLTWNFTTSNVGSTIGTEAVIVGSGLAASGGAYYSPPAYLTGANTVNGTQLTATLPIVPPTQAFSTTFALSFKSPDNTSSITSYYGEGLVGGYKLNLVDYGPIA